jgi:hypothetical protein
VSDVGIAVAALEKAEVPPGGGDLAAPGRAVEAPIGPDVGEQADVDPGVLAPGLVQAHQVPGLKAVDALHVPAAPAREAVAVRTDDWPAAPRWPRSGAGGIGVQATGPATGSEGGRQGPAPRGGLTGHTLDLSGNSETPRREVLHPTLAFRAEHLWRAGAISAPFVASSLDTLRGLHLLWLREQTGRDDYAADTDGDLL